MDPNGLADPYVKLNFLDTINNSTRHVNNSHYKTKRVNTNLNPEWNDTFVMCVIYILTSGSRDLIRFHGRSVSRNAVILFQQCERIGPHVP